MMIYKKYVVTVPTNYDAAVIFNGTAKNQWTILPRLYCV
jgi:hypothetical protein